MEQNPSYYCGPRQCDANIKDIWLPDTVNRLGRRNWLEITSGFLAVSRIINYYRFKLWPHFLLLCHPVVTPCRVSTSADALAERVIQIFKVQGDGEGDTAIEGRDGFSLTYRILLRRDFEHVKHDSIETFLQVWGALVAEGLWAAALLGNKHTHTEKFIEMMADI